MSFIGGLVGGKIQEDAAKDATRAQVDAANRQIDVFQDVYDQTREDFAPYIEQGHGAYDLLTYELNPQSLQGSRALPNAPYNALADDGSVFSVVGSDGSVLGEYGSRHEANEAYLGARGAAEPVRDTYNPAFPISGHNKPSGFTPQLVWNDKDGRWDQPKQHHLRSQAEEYARSKADEPAPIEYSIQETTKPVERTPAQASIKASPQSGVTLFDDTPFHSFLNEVGSDYELTDDFAFRRDEGLKGIERGFAAKGQLNSGAAQKALIRYAEGIASQGRGEHVDRLVSGYGTYLQGLGALSDRGFNATTAIANAGAQRASGTSSALANVGEAQSAGQIAQGNFLSGGVQSAFDFAEDAVLGGGSSFFGNVVGG